MVTGRNIISPFMVINVCVSLDSYSIMKCKISCNTLVSKRHKGRRKGKRQKAEGTKAQSIKHILIDKLITELSDSFVGAALSPRFALGAAGAAALNTYKTCKSTMFRTHTYE